MSTTTVDPDLELMLRVQRDEAGAFAELVSRFGSRVYSHFLRQFGDRIEAEDLSQDVFLRLYRSRKSYTPRAALTTWIYIIARNVARNAIRARRRRYSIPLDGDRRNEENLGIDVADRATGPSHLAEREELACVVRDAIATLNGRQRRAVELQFDNHSYNEIAIALDVTPKAAKCLLYRARHELRDVLLAYSDS
jgi:RNA polymerase sigma-70 factor (ECF subfamily)